MVLARQVPYTSIQAYEHRMYVLIRHALNKAPTPPPMIHQLYPCRSIPRRASRALLILYVPIRVSIRVKQYMLHQPRAVVAFHPESRICVWWRPISRARLAGRGVLLRKDHSAGGAKRRLADLVGVFGREIFSRFEGSLTALLVLVAGFTQPSSSRPASSSSPADFPSTCASPSTSPAPYPSCP